MVLTGRHGGLRLAVGSLVGLLVLAVLIGAGVLVAPTVRAQEPSVDELRAEARRISDELEAMNTRISVLDEDYNGAILEMGVIEADLARARSRLDGARSESAAVADEVAAFAVQSYIGSDAESIAANDDFEQYGARLTYAEAAIGSGRDAIEDLKVSQDRTGDEIERLAELEAEAEALARQIESQRLEIESIVTDQTELLSEVRGDLDDAVRAEQERRLAEELARAEEAERRRAAAEAERARDAEAAAAREAAARGAAEAANAAESPTDSEAPSSTVPSTTPPVADPAETTPTTTVAPTPTPDSPASPPAGGAHPSALAAVEAAKTQLGVRYRWGGESPSTGFDCSGLITWAYRTAAGISVPHQSRAQYATTRRISIDELVPGDLVFFGSPIHHVGMYVGGGQMIEAPYTGATVRYRSIYRRDMAGAGRVVG